MLIVYQKAHGFSQQLITQLAQEIVKSGYHAQRMQLKPDQLDRLKLKNQQLLIAVGSNTTKILLDTKVKTPMLSILMPRHISNSLKNLYPDKKNWSSLLLDQPLKRQFHLITAIMGSHKETGVLLGPYTNDLKKTLHTAAAKTSHKIKTEYVESSDTLSPSLKALNNTVDILLTLPDPSIYNKNTIRGILLLSYRNKLPIIGFSKAYVKAGAIAALYSKPEQISQQTMDITRHFFEAGTFKLKTYYPESFSIALNKKVARSLGIKLKKNTEIIKQIKKTENIQ